MRKNILTSSEICCIMCLRKYIIRLRNIKIAKLYNHVITNNPYKTYEGGT